MLSERISALWLRLKALVRRRELDRDLDDELAFHLAMREQKLREQGLSPGEAPYAARRQFGNVTLLKETSRELWGFRSLETLWQDLRYGTRQLRKNPGFTLVAVLTLALGIGANTAIFSLLNDAILQRLPIPRPQELVQLTWLQRYEGGSNFNWPEFQPLLDPQPALRGLLAYLRREANLHMRDVSERVRVQQVSGSYYSTLKVQAFAGRILGAADDLPRAAPAAVLSYSYWRRRFGLDASVLGKTVFLDGMPLTVVGVTPPGFSGIDRLSPPDITCSLHAVPLPGGASYYVYLFARLQPGASLEEARAQVRARFRALLEGELRPQRSWMSDMRLDVHPAATGEYGVRFELGVPLGVLGVLVGIALLICCTNLTSLLLGRTLARSREIAVRLALGAGRWRVIRQLLTESVLLGIGGGCLGLVVGYWVHQLLVTLLAIDRSEAVQFRLHMPVLAFTACVSMATMMVFGLAPALRATRLTLGTLMKGEPPRASRLRLNPARAFLIVQVAASVVLLAGATMFVRTLLKLKTLDAGFNREGLLLMTIDPRASRFQSDRVTGLLDELMEKVPAVPGVRTAALAWIPLFGHNAQKSIWVQGHGHGDGDAVNFNIVGPGFFATAGIPLLMGREFSPRDRTGAPLVGIVNEAFARKYFTGQNPLNQRFGDQGPNSAGKYQIIGVVKDARYTSLRLAPRPAIFQSLWQFSQYPPFVLHVRVSGDPGTTAASVRRDIQTIDSGLVVYDVRTMTEQVNATLRLERTFAMLCTLFGALALGLCCVGLYGVASYSVTRRAKEIGVRMALGAARADVLWLFLRETLALFVIGVVIGTPVALACTRLIKSLLFGMTPSDPSSLIFAILTLGGVAAIASVLPARRASKVDPMVALRYE